MINVNQTSVLPMLPFGPLPGLFMGGSSSQQLGNLSQLFSGLAEALQGLADLVGGLEKAVQGKPVAPGTPLTPTPISSAPVSSGGSSSAAPIAGKARIWGDPHFIGADGDKFDVQGEAGKIYNLLSDRGFQLNGKFEAYGSGGATVVGKAAINADGNFIDIDKSGETVVNGITLKDGQKVNLFGGGTVEKKGDHIIVNKGEWKVDFEANGQYLNMDIETKNAIADGVKPQGLIGQTFDGDGKALIGDAGAGAQGGGAIKDIHGNVTKAGDKDAVKSYEVNSMYSSFFRHHNARGDTQFIFEDGMPRADQADSVSGGLPSPQQSLKELQDNLVRIAMMGFFALASGLSASSVKPWGTSY